MAWAKAYCRQAAAGVRTIASVAVTNPLFVKTFAPLNILRKLDQQVFGTALVFLSKTGQTKQSLVFAQSQIKYLLPQTDGSPAAGANHRQPFY